MAEVLQWADQSRAKEVVILLDCCFSGNLGNPPMVNNAKASLREGISILTAGRGDQPSVETGGGGLFTSLVVDALEGGAADLLGNVSAPAIYSYVEAALGAWGPSAKNVSTFQELQSLSRVHLVTPVGTTHMYNAAMQSKACRLTPTGLYYWRLAKDHRIQTLSSRPRCSCLALALD